MKRALLLTVLLARAASANEEFFGFTADSKFAVITESTRDFVTSGEDPEGTQVNRVVWKVSALGEGDSIEFTEEKEFDAWLEKHPIDGGKPSRTSPDGKAKAEVTFDPNVGAGTWTETYWFSNANWTLAITRGGKTRAVEHCSGATSIEVVWSPNGKHTAWILNHYHPSFNIRGFESGGTETNILIASEESLAISVAAPTRERGKAAAKLLKKASYDDAAISIALKKREETVIYFAREQKETAQEMVKLFPGSSIEPMTWVAPFDVVVALGSK